VVEVPRPPPRSRPFDPCLLAEQLPARTFRPVTLLRSLPAPVLCPSAPVLVPARLRLQRCSARWATADYWSGRLVSQGLFPDFFPFPPPIDRGDSLLHCRRSPPEQMKKEIELLLASGAVRIVREEELKTTPGVISRVFPVPRKDGRIRMVINLRTINPFVPPIYFKMEGLRTVRSLLQQNDFMVKIDLEEAFHHVSIHPNAQRYFRFRWAGVVYQWLAMPFGYRDAPRTFTRLMRVIAKEARARGLRVVVYMDDILLMASSAEQAVQHREILLQLLREFGMSISLKKCVLTPTQLMPFLGVDVDSSKMMFFLPKEKMERLSMRAHKMRVRSQAGKRTNLFYLQKLVGHLQSVSDCILPARLHSNSLREALRSAQARFTVMLSPEAVQDLLWWELNLPQCNGKSLLDPLPDHQFDTDASEKGWGAVYFPAHGPRLNCQGFFTEELTSNTRELSAVWNGIRSLVRATGWSSCSVRVRTDNQVTLSYVNRMGGREPHLARIAEAIHSYCLELKIHLQAVYLPGVDNSIADRLSRVEADSSESKLHPQLFQLLESAWGPHSLDGLASSTNTQLTRYVSYRHDPSCLYADLFSRAIARKENVYLFPPASGPLIPRCLDLIRRDQISATMILPVWPSQFWWPLLWQLSQDLPIILPRHPATLSNWVEGKQVESLPFWPLAAVRLSGNVSLQKDFQQRLLTLCSPRIKEEKILERTKHMMTAGHHSNLGAQAWESARLISVSLTSFAMSLRC
jgi:ribonuclease HI